MEDKDGNQMTKGSNPFYNIFSSENKRLSNYVTCYESEHLTSKKVYSDISENMEQLIEDAINNKDSY